MNFGMLWRCREMQLAYQEVMMQAFLEAEEFRERGKCEGSRSKKSREQHKTKERKEQCIYAVRTSVPQQESVTNLKNPFEHRRLIQWTGQTAQSSLCSHRRALVLLPWNSVTVGPLLVPVHW